MKSFDIRPAAKRILLLIQAIVVLLIILPPRLRADAKEISSISIEAETDKGMITIGELLQYTILVRHTASIRILGTIQFPNPRDFEVKTEKEIPVRTEDGKQISGRQFTVTAYGLGDFVIDEATVSYLDENGEQKNIQSNRLYITVESVDKTGKAKVDIRPIKKPWDMQSQILKQSLTAGTAFLLTVFIFFLWRYFGKRKKTEVRTEEILSPYEEAIRDLNRLFESSLIREGKVKQYYYALSEAIKRYLEKRFLFRASEKTTDEILREIRKLKFEDPLRQSIRLFLEEVDIVKFALYFPPPAEISRINRDALGIVEKTKPAEELSPAGAERPLPESRKAAL